jgi:hypothetical protein
MSDLGAAGEPVHSDGESVASAWPHRRLDSPFAGLMEKNMSKSNDSSKLGRAPQVRELRDDELEKVSGGLDANKNEVAVEGAVSVELQKKHITKFKFEPTSFEFGLTHSNE